MDLVSSLDNIIPHLESFEDIVTLKSLGRGFNRRLSSPEFAKYYHWSKYGVSPPDILYYWNPGENRLEDTPWRLEFSFIPPKFFFRVGKKLYLNAFLAYKNALREKQKNEARFISTLFGIEITPLERYYLVIPSFSGDLTNKQIEYVTEVYREAKRDLMKWTTIPNRDMRNLTNYYVSSMAQYGDIEYFQERVLEEDLYPSREDIVEFVREMINYGKERLLEAYREYFSEEEDFYIEPFKYHPDQWKIPGVDRDRLEVIAASNNMELFEVIKKQRDTCMSTPQEEECLRRVMVEVEGNADFLKWMIKFNPELIPDWYDDIDGIYTLTKFRGQVEDVGSSLGWYVRDAYAQDPSWEEIIAWITFSDTGLKYLLRNITNSYHDVNYPLFFETLEWDKEKTLTLLRELLEEKIVRPVSYPKYSYNLLLAALAALQENI